MRNRDVLISGAGVAGLALGYWLRRLGFSPVVVERASAPRDGGQAVDLRGAAIEVARRTGILDAARAARTGTRGMSYVSSAGKRLASLNGAFGVIDPQDVEIVRGDLVSRQIWLQNQGIRALPYMPGKNWILSLATRGVTEAANAVTLPSVS